MKTPLLLTLYLPLLPLETLRPSWCDAGVYVIVNRDQVLVASAGAVDAGVRVGMRRGGVATIAPGAVMLDRDLEKEARALDAIAMAMLQFTPRSRLLRISVCCSMLGELTVVRRTAGVMPPD